MRVKIGEVAAQAGVSVDAVRLYERRGLLQPARRKPSGYRDYAPDTIDRIRLARRLQALGLTLNEIAAALHAHDDGNATCASERWRLESVRDRIAAKLQELTELQASVNDALAACESGHCPLAQSS